MSSSDRVLRLIEQVANAETPLTQSELATATGLPRSTTFTLLADLCRLGFVDRVDRRYVPGFRLQVLGHQVTQKSHLRERLRPLLETVTAATGETTLLMVEVGATEAFAGELLLVDQVASPSPVRYVAEFPGTRPIYPSAAGRVILAFTGRTAAHIPPQAIVRHTVETKTDLAAIDADLDQIRALGYCLQFGERIPGMASIAAPVRDPAGTVVGSVVAIGPSERFRTAERTFWPVLRDALALPR